MRNEEVIEAIYQYIRRYVAEHGFPPTIYEIAAACYMSKTNVIRYLDKLETLELISREPGKSRGIRLRQEKGGCD